MSFITPCTARLTEANRAVAQYRRSSPGYGRVANCTNGDKVFAEPFFGVMADWSHG